jgi:hypothetical protein
MKIFIIGLTLLSTSAFAGFNDFECNFFGINGERIEVNVESSFGPGTKIINVIVTTANSVQEYEYFTSARIDAMNRISYFGSGMDLEIDLWPHPVPRYGAFYRSEFSSFDVNQGRTYYNVNCQYRRF